MNSSVTRRAAAMVGAGLVLATSIAGFSVYSYLKPTASPSASIESVAMEVPQASAGTVYELHASQARFVVDEVLRGTPYTVVGRTDRIAGQLILDANDTTTTQLGTVLVDARTLATDDAQRNRALGNKILHTDEYEYISFTPAAIEGLPQKLAPGQAYDAQLSGDLTIKGVTRPAVFNVSVTPTADGRITGTATTAIQYADWGLSIPSVPFVASVDDTVTLQLDFGAIAEA